MVAFDARLQNNAGSETTGRFAKKVDGFYVWIFRFDSEEEAMKALLCVRI
jgi:hypothetical protein